MTHVRLTFEARKRYPDIGTRVGTVALTEMCAGLPLWVLVRWSDQDGLTRTWLPAGFIEPVAPTEPDAPPPLPLDGA